MTAEEVIDGLLEREGQFRAAVKRPDGTWDPDTYRGITADTYGNFLGLQRPATRTELLNMSMEHTRTIYQVQYIERPGFVQAAIPYEPLRVQLIDFGVQSGPTLAIRWLQRVLKQVRPTLAVDGVLGPQTAQMLRDYSGCLVWVNDALVAVRSKMLDDLTDSGRMRKADEEGVESRALKFLVTRS